MKPFVTGWGKLIMYGDYIEVVWSGARNLAIYALTF
ncbi:uncharacterized protein METZ01_LOCUS230093 [marine metagenome]|uniref:Uncharacterized protein n=1 Tax=marine metagenome TaxID=408172 RepID=A0A382GQH6_9ZZZZ